MKTPNDGGPAFPVAPYQVGGMTLRQWYAGRALANHDITAGDTYEGVAKSCFKIADAMIAHEAKGRQGDNSAPSTESEA